MLQLVSGGVQSGSSRARAPPPATIQRNIYAVPKSGLGASRRQPGDLGPWFSIRLGAVYEVHASFLPTRMVALKPNGKPQPVRRGPGAAPPGGSWAVQLLSREE